MDVVVGKDMVYDESKMCFMAVANTPYQKYIPWFLYFLNRAYPKSRKLVLLDGKITNSVNQMLELLDGNYEVRECAFLEYSVTDANTSQCLRWLVYEQAFEQYDCMSIGDIDMAVYRESPSYMEQHLSHCEQLGIPYSNFIRSMGANPRRVCGIHVVKPKEWFPVMRPIIKKYRSMLLAGTIHLPSEGFDERLLLQMIVESDLGEPPANLSETYFQSLVTSHHHGTHIRLAECSGIPGLKEAKGYKTHKPEILAAVQTPLFDKLLTMSPEIGVLLQAIAEAYELY